MTDQKVQRSSWLIWSAYGCLGAGAVLMGIAVLQLFTTVDLLDSPWQGAVGFWFIGYGLLHIARRKAASADQEDAPEHP